MPAQRIPYPTPPPTIQTAADPAPFAHSYTSDGKPLYELGDFLPCHLRTTLICDEDSDNAEMLVLLAGLVADLEQTHDAMRFTVAQAGVGELSDGYRRRLHTLGLRLAALCADEV